MPRWTSCYIDPRAISNEGQWGLYKCEKCGKLFKARMCAKKRVKHIYCSTQCKKNSQIKINRPQISNKDFKAIYNKYYNKVQRTAFTLCSCALNRQNLEDMMQYGFLELWFIKNRNNFNCSEKYIDKALRHAITSNFKWYWVKQRNYKTEVHYDSIEEMDKWDKLSQKIG